MRYFGGKSRTCARIASYLNSIRRPGQLYVEPFVGAGWVLQLMDNPREASDICEDLILLYRAIQNGWEPPSELSENEYQRLKTSDPSALRAFAGFGCSFAGKWFGGYARSGQRNYASNCHNSLVEKARPALEGVEFYCRSYSDVNPVGTLIYCDPPYQGTTGYSAAGRFDWDLFWDTVRRWSEKNVVVVSEYSAPDDFDVVLEIPTKLDIRSSVGKEQRIERLFRHNSNWLEDIWPSSNSVSYLSCSVVYSAERSPL